MTDIAKTSPAEIYSRIADTLAADAGFETALIEDFGGTLRSRFGIAVPASASLSRSGEGFRLDWNGRAYEIGDPRRTGRSELNDAELELVSGGVAECPNDSSLKDPNGKYYR